MLHKANYRELMPQLGRGIWCFGRFDPFSFPRLAKCDSCPAAWNQQTGPGWQPLTNAWRREAVGEDSAERASAATIQRLHERWRAYQQHWCKAADRRL